MICVTRNFISAGFSFGVYWRKVILNCTLLEEVLKEHNVNLWLTFKGSVVIHTQIEDVLFKVLKKINSNLSLCENSIKWKTKSSSGTLIWVRAFSKTKRKKSFLRLQMSSHIKLVSIWWLHSWGWADFYVATGKISVLRYLFNDVFSSIAYLTEK